MNRLWVGTRVRAACPLPGFPCCLGALHSPLPCCCTFLALFSLFLLRPTSYYVGKVLPLFLFPILPLLPWLVPAVTMFNMSRHLELCLPPTSLAVPYRCTVYTVQTVRGRSCLFGKWKGTPVLSVPVSAPHCWACSTWSRRRSSLCCRLGHRRPPGVVTILRALPRLEATVFPARSISYASLMDTLA